jgi:hypothetical protein
MSEQGPDESETGWLLEPPGPGEVHVNIMLGSDVELSSEARAALETLMSTLEESEVSGFALDLSAKCPGLRTCSPYGKCTPLTSAPTCMRYVHCRIAEIM